MSLRALAIPAVIAVFLILCEIALEARAHQRGFGTLVGTVADEIVTKADVERDGERPFPFSGEPLSPSTVAASEPIIWVASSSYALGDDAFPIVAQADLRSSGLPDALILTEATVGASIPMNARRLRDTGAEWRPDVVVLYQLTNDLHGLAAPDSESPEDAAAEEGSPRRAEPLRRIYEQTTLYAQLTANFTPWVSQYRLSPASVPAAADSVFSTRIRGFVELARELGAIPVLGTLATSHELDQAIPRDRRFWMLRWNPHLSPEAYLRTVEMWNELIRQTASELGVQVWDAQGLLGGDAEYFTDLVHLTPEGHRILGEALAVAVEQAWSGRADPR